MTHTDLSMDEELKSCVDFHGHLCPGLAIGFVAAKEGLKRLQETRSEDEEIVSIVETDACCVDAVQVMTGCTFGKGNFFYRDYGKVAMTFLSRESEKAWRFSLKPDAVSLSERHRELLARSSSKKASPAEIQEFQILHRQKSHEIIQIPCEELFAISEVPCRLPPKAKIEPSRLCDRCREPVMASKLIGVGGEAICGECMDKHP